MSRREAWQGRRQPVAAVTAASGRPADEREARRWVDDLRRGGSAGQAAEELRSYLRRGLRHALGRRGVGDHDVEDFVQDALVRVLEKLDTFRGDSRFTTWAMAVAIRVAFGALRRRRREQLLGDVDPAVLDGLLDAPAPPDPGGRLERRTVLDALHAAIHQCLTDRQRAAVLGELAGVPSEELARRLGTTRNALYKLHHDARRKLRRAIVDAGIGGEDVRRELARASEGS